MGLLADGLRGHVRDADAAIATLNRLVTEAIAAGRPTAGLLAEIRAISESRNFIVARLRRLDGTKPQVRAPEPARTTSTLEKSL